MTELRQDFRNQIKIETGFSSGLRRVQSVRILGCYKFCNRGLISWVYGCSHGDIKLVWILSNKQHFGVCQLG